MDNNIEEKKADNKVYDEFAAAKKRKELEEVEDIRDNFVLINRGINRCLDLLNSSIKRTNRNSEFEDIRRDNNRNLAKALEKIDNKKLEIEEKYREYKEEETKEE